MRKIIGLMAVVFMYNICFGEVENPTPKAQNQQAVEAQKKGMEKKEMKAEKKEMKAEKKGMKVKTLKFVGIVEEVNLSSSTIRVRNIKQEDDIKTFVIGGDVEIRINGKEGRLDQVKPESHIVIKYEGDIEQPEVKKINVQLKRETKEFKKEHKRKGEKLKQKTSSSQN